MLLTRMYACSNKHMVFRKNTRGILIINDDNVIHRVAVKDKTDKTVVLPRFGNLLPFPSNMASITFGLARLKSMVVVLFHSQFIDILVSFVILCNGDPM